MRKRILPWLIPFLGNKKPIDDLVNANFVFFAQFVDHDMTNTFPKPMPIDAQGNVLPFMNKFDFANSLCCGPTNANFSVPFVPRTQRTRFWCISMK